MKYNIYMYITSVVYRIFKFFIINGCTTNVREGVWHRYLRQTLSFAKVCRERILENVIVKQHPSRSRRSSKGMHDGYLCVEIEDKDVLVCNE